MDGRAAAISIDRNARRPVPRVAREHDEIAIGEDIARLAGKHAGKPHVAVNANTHVRQHGIDQAAGDDADHALDRFVWANEVRGSARLEGKLLEQAHVDV